MIVLLLAYVGVSRGQRYYTTIWLRGSAKVNTNSYSIVFGDDFTTKYDISLRDQQMNKDIPDAYACLEIYLQDNTGSIFGPMSVVDFKKLYIGYYKVRIGYKGSIIHDFMPDNQDGTNDGKTLTVLPRPISIANKMSAPFHCMYNGGKVFKFSDFDDGTGSSVNKNLFMSSFQLSGLADFDKTTQIDYENSTVEFPKAESSETESQNITIHWAFKSVPADGDTKDWTANYTCVLPGTETECECTNVDRVGYIHNKCPYTIVWQKGDAAVSENVELTYGAKVGADDYATKSYYELVPLMYDNGNLVDESLTIENSKDGFIFKPYTEGTIMSKGEYVFKASSINNTACKSQINVKIEPLKIMPIPEGIVTEKNYDGDYKLLSSDKIKAKPSKDFLGTDGEHIQIKVSAKYDSPESGDRQVILDYELEGDDVKNNYELLVVSQEMPGKINPIQPTIKWTYHNSDCADQTKQSINYGESINEVVAVLQLGEFDAFRGQYTTTAVYEVYHNGVKVDDITALQAGETYQLDAEFTSNNPTNLLPASSSIKINVEKLQIKLKLNGSNEKVYGAKVGDELSYITENILESPQSEIQYEYFISDNLNITEEELFSMEPVAFGFVPSAGEYMFGCKAKDVNGYMLDGQKMDQIEIKKSSVLQKIDPPEIVTKKNYDGNWFAEVKTPANFQGVQLETVAYYVDGDVATDATQLSETDFRVNYGWNYSIFYTVEVPSEISDNCNLYIRSTDENDQPVYVPYVPGDFTYYDGGIIDCNDVEVSIDVPEPAIYGDCVLGGNDADDVRLYTMVNGQAVTLSGEWDIWGNYNVGDILDAKEHKNVLVFYNIDLDYYNGNYCESPYSTLNVTVQPRTLTFVGDLNIADKTYDGTDIINSNGVVTTFENGVVDASKLSVYFPANQQIRRVPSVEGVISQDYGKVSVKWDYSNTKYSGSAVKYTDDTELEVAAYENIPVGVSLEGSRASNYKLPQDVVYGSSKIMPENPVEIVFDYISPEPPIADLTYRLMYGKSVMGVDFKLKDECLQEGWYERYVLNSEDCTNKMMSPKVNADEYYTFEVQIVKGDRQQDAANNTYKVLARQSVKIYVDKYKLKVSTPNIVTQKEYDGNTSVAWINGNNCVITNAVEGDDVALDGEPVIQYDTPEVGTGKTITATYTLKGNDLYKYLLPPDNYTTIGSITKKPEDPKDPEDPQDPKDPEDPPTPGKITIADVTPVSGGGGTVSPNEDGYCAGEQITLNIKISEGAPTYCKLVFDEKSKTAGFKDVSNGDLVALGNGVYQTAFECPGATYGKYGGQVYLYDDEGNASTGYPFELQVNYSSKYLKAKFNDVVLVDNHEKPRLFSEANPDVTYQWYIRENGVDQNVPGETKQFYNVPTMDAWYGAYAKTSGDEWIKICPKYFGKTLSKSYVEPSVSVYPNPATSMEPVTIKINDFESDSYKNVIIYLYNSTGSLIKTIENVEELNVVSLPFGNYSGIVVFDGNKISFKFIVRK